MPFDSDTTRWLDSKGAPHCSQCGGNTWAARGHPLARGQASPAARARRSYSSTVLGETLQDWATLWTERPSPHRSLSTSRTLRMDRPFRAMPTSAPEMCRLSRGTPDYPAPPAPGFSPRVRFHGKPRSVSTKRAVRFGWRTAFGLEGSAQQHRVCRIGPIWLGSWRTTGSRSRASCRWGSLSSLTSTSRS